MRYPWLDVESSKLWTEDAAVPHAILGCNGQCQAKIRAPALFPSTASTTHHAPVVVSVVEKRRSSLRTFVNGLSLTDLLLQMENWDLDKNVELGAAPPLESYLFLISINLVIDDDREKVALTTGYTTPQSDSSNQDCEVTFTYETCLLEPGIGEYQVLIQDNQIIMSSLAAPTQVAKSNHTGFQETIPGEGGTHSSTLAGIVLSSNDRWNAFVSDWSPEPGNTISLSKAGFLVELYQRNHDASQCPTYRNPKEDVMTSLNKLMYVSATIEPPGCADTYLLVGFTMVDSLAGISRRTMTRSTWKLAQST